MSDQIEVSWNPEFEAPPELHLVMPEPYYPDYGMVLPDPGRSYLPADEPSGFGPGPGFDPGLESPFQSVMPAGFDPGPGFDPGLESEFQVVEPSWGERAWDIWGAPEIAPLRDSLLQKYVLKPETETVNTAGRTETNVNPYYTPPRGSVPIQTIPQQTVFWPWQQAGDIGDAPQGGPGLGVSPGVLLIGGLALFLLTR